MHESNVPTKTFSFGSCSFARTSPSVEGTKFEAKMLNVVISFEEALKLNLAIQEGLLKLNSYKRSTAAGKATALNLAINLKDSRVSINEGKI